MNVYRKAIELIEKEWAESGASEQTCKPCIAAGRGCCDGCSLLGPKGCMSKPILCALWTCSEIRAKYPKLQRKMTAIKAFVPAGFFRDVDHEMAPFVTAPKLVQITSILAEKRG